MNKYIIVKKKFVPCCHRHLQVLSRFFDGEHSPEQMERCRVSLVGLVHEAQALQLHFLSSRNTLATPCFIQPPYPASAHLCLGVLDNAACCYLTCPTPTYTEATAVDIKNQTKPRCGAENKYPDHLKRSFHCVRT